MTIPATPFVVITPMFGNTPLRDPLLMVNKLLGRLIEFVIIFAGMTEKFSIVLSKTESRI